MILTPDAKPDYADEYVYYEDDPSLVAGSGNEDYYYYDYEDDFRNPNYFPEKAGPNSVGYWPKVIPGEVTWVLVMAPGHCFMKVANVLEN